MLSPIIMWMILLSRIHAYQECLPGQACDGQTEMLQLRAADATPSSVAANSVAAKRFLERVAGTVAQEVPLEKKRLWSYGAECQQHTLAMWQKLSNVHRGGVKAGEISAQTHALSPTLHLSQGCQTKSSHALI